VKPKLRVWVVFLDRVKIGAGRAELLEAIDELGSIKAAAARFGMSYRYAWGYLRELEQAAGFRFIERQRGGGETGGATLTAQGKAFLNRYWEFHRRLDAAAAREYARIFRGH
jgi:molybdate transport system regulatory protein